MPLKPPGGQERTLEQPVANQALHQRRRRIAPAHSRVQRCRIVKDQRRLWHVGIRDLVMARCCAWHTFWVRLTPWQSMVASGYTPLFPCREATLMLVVSEDKVARTDHSVPPGTLCAITLLPSPHHVDPLGV
jgi:hypothetical protein